MKVSMALRRKGGVSSPCCAALTLPLIGRSLIFQGGVSGDPVPSVHAKTLQRAAEIVGGEQELALRLQVTPSHLALWIQGIEQPPGDIFLRAVDLVVDNDVLSKLPNRSSEPAKSERS
jgi:hypothetical protein